MLYRHGMMNHKMKFQKKIKKTSSKRTMKKINKKFKTSCPISLQRIFPQMKIKKLKKKN